jgi:hypothetical protein
MVNVTILQKTVGGRELIVLLFGEVKKDFLYQRGKIK